MATIGGRELSKRETTMVLLLGVVALLGLAYAAFAFLGGDGEEQALEPQPGPPSPTSLPTATASPSPVPLTPERFEGRDPFQPLVVPPPPPGTGAGDGATGGADGVTGDGVTGDGGTGDGTAGGGGSTTTTGGVDRDGDGVADGESRRVTLLDIFSRDGERRVSVRVGDEEFTARQGERFADNFRVMNIARRCATFVFGDERFRLCIGQEVRK